LLGHDTGDMKRFVFILSIVAVSLSAAWFIAQPGYEPAITFIVGVVGAIGSLFRSRRPKTDEATAALLRPHRLSARNALLSFADFCLTYKTLHPQTTPDRTHNLSAEIDRLKATLEFLGPLSLPKLAPLQSDLVAHPGNFQRLLDRQAGPDPQPINREFQTIEDNIDGIVDWFADVKERIKKEIDPYLEM